MNRLLYILCFFSLSICRTFAFQINGKNCFIDSNNTHYFTYNSDSMRVSSNSKVLINKILFDEVRLEIGNYEVIEGDDTFNLIISGLPIMEIRLKESEQLLMEKCDTCEMMQVEASLIDTNSVFSVYNAQFKVRGASSAGYEKKSFAIEFVDSCREELKTNILGLERKDGKYVLNAMYIDRSLMRNKVLMDMWMAFDSVPYIDKEPKVVNGQRTEYLELLLDGHYYGLFTIGDKINRSHLKLKKYSGNEYRGLLFKSVEHDLNDYKVEASAYETEWLNYEAKYPGKVGTSAFPILRKWLIDMDNMETKNHIDYDAKNLIDYALFIAITYALDNEGKNLFLSCYNYNELPMFFVTPWDLDATLGRDYRGVKIDETMDSTLLILLNRYVSTGINTNYFSAKKRWLELKNRALSPSYLDSLLLKNKKLIVTSGAFDREFSAFPRPLGLFNNESQPTLDDEVKFISDWYRRSWTNMDKYWNQFIFIDTFRVYNWEIKKERVVVRTDNGGYTRYYADVSLDTVYSCLDDSKVYRVLTADIDGYICDTKYVDETLDIVPHQFSESLEWSWSENYVSAIVSLVCNRDTLHPHFLDLSANVVIDTVEYNCGGKAKIKYIAYAESENVIYSDSVFVKLDSVPHIKKHVNYIETSEFQEGYSGDTICERCGMVFALGNNVSLRETKCALDRVYVSESQDIVVENSSLYIRIFNPLGIVVYDNYSPNNLETVKGLPTGIYIVEFDEKSKLVLLK